MAKKTDMDKVAGEMLRLEKRRLADLTKYEGNPRIIERAIPQVQESIRQCGYITPIVIDEDGVILAGHTRYEALKQNGAEECDVVVAVGLSEEQRKKYRLLDNKTGEIATWDNRKLKTEILGLDFEGFDFGQEKIETEVFKETTDTEPKGTDRKTVTCPRCNAEVPV